MKRKLQKNRSVIAEYGMLWTLLDISFQKPPLCSYNGLNTSGKAFHKILDCGKLDI